ncbi:MAG: polyprenyl synthetase family protein [Bacteroidota bacterium]
MNSSNLKSSIDAHINSLGLAEREPSNLYKPMEYILSLKGKRIRPILTLLAYQAVSDKPMSDAMNLACSVELFHNFTLMHDDIMDRAPVRRGKPCVHVVWGEDVAILSGDALFALSMELVVEGFPERAAALCKGFTRIAMGVCEGQMEDMDFASQQLVSIPQYLEMIRKKTAVLLGGCLSLGALAGGASQELVEQFRTYGESLGIAFQLQDDLMDAFPPEGFGKQVGGDIIENKKTYLLLKAQELASPSQQARIQDFLAMTDPASEKVSGMLKLFQELNIKSLTQELIQRYFDRAKQAGEVLAKQTKFLPIEHYLQEIIDRKV